MDRTENKEFDLKYFNQVINDFDDKVNILKQISTTLEASNNLKLIIENKKLFSENKLLRKELEELQKKIGKSEIVTAKLKEEINFLRNHLENINNISCHNNLLTKEQREKQIKDHKALYKRIEERDKWEI